MKEAELDELPLSCGVGAVEVVKLALEERDDEMVGITVLMKPHTPVMGSHNAPLSL